MDARRRAALALACLFAALDHPLRVPAAGLVPERLWAGSDDALAGALRLSARDRDILRGFRRSYSHEHMAAVLRERGVAMVALGEDDYPLSLAGSYDPPLALFMAGKPTRLKEFMAHARIAIVGSRAATEYGRDAARFLAGGLARAGVGVISGMALGIDAAAHDAALAARGRTLAVLGCGADVVYPAANRSLYQDLLKNGLVISEYPPGTPPRPWRFPARNRIIAGLADGVVVVEAAEKSGALITADFCLEQGGEVLAVPGSIFSRSSAGANRLIGDGAVVVTAVADILEAIGLQPEAGGAEVMTDKVADGAAAIVAALGPRPLPVDVIARKCGLDAAAVIAALTALELGGSIRFEPGRGYCL
ncbi:MAG: DNA-processing protein DprA [Thermoleophilia bacterium]